MKGTSTHALCFGGLDTVLQGYVDSDMAGDKDNRRSTVIWILKLQKVVALSTIEVEYVVAIEARDRKSTRLNSSHPVLSRMPSSA